MKPGDIVLVKFPFANLEQSKKRPALLLARTPVTSKASLLTVAMITSQVDGMELSGDVRVQSWQKATLLHPSLIRLSKIATVDSELVERKLGSLTEDDLKEVKRAFRDLYSAWL